MKRTFILSHSIARGNALECVRTAPDGYMVTVQEPTRSLEQNAAQWPILDAFSNQLWWTIIVNGLPMQTKLTPEEWKDILTAAFRNESVRIAQGLDGGMVMLGLRTRNMGKREFSEWLEFLHATAALRGIVVYTDSHEDKPTSDH